MTGHDAMEDICDMYNIMCIIYITDISFKF